MRKLWKQLLAVLLILFTIGTQMETSVMTVQAASKVNPKSVTLNYSNYYFEKRKNRKIKGNGEAL